MKIDYVSKEAGISISCDCTGDCDRTTLLELIETLEESINRYLCEANAEEYYQVARALEEYSRRMYRVHQEWSSRGFKGRTKQE
jgi:hypothetical protein